MSPTTKNRRGASGRSRRGVALVVVLLIVAAALATSYSLVRSQGTAMRIQANAALRAQARSAAITGLAVARKNMHTSAWAGVDTTLAGSIGDTQRWQVSFTTGDPSLAPGDPDYEELPYRVTLLSTGYATDPADPKRISSHQVRAVLRLVPRALADEPAGWDDVTGHTLFQLGAGEAAIGVPLRTEGPVRFQGRLDLGEAYDWSHSVRSRYLGDLNGMRSGGGPDYRPFNGPLRLPFAAQSGGLISLLTGDLGVAAEDVAAAPVSLAQSGYVSGYQLYPGGTVYQPEYLPGIVHDRTFEPDPETNPLGIFVHEGTVNIYDNVTVRGTVVASGTSTGDVHLRAGGIRIESQGLPPLEGSDEPVRLPCLVLEDDFRVHPGAEASIEGMVNATQDFEITSDDHDGIRFAVTGHVAAANVLVRGRTDFDQTKGWWNDRHTEYLAQRSSGLAYFPEYVAAAAGLEPEPQLVVVPDTTPVRYHWKNPDDPIYVPHPDDEGLRWELLEWDENP